MKKTKIIGFLLLGLFALTSCEKDLGVVINPKAEDGSLVFKLNQTQYEGWVYELEMKNENLSMDALTCVQPDYGIPLAVTYTVQTSFLEDFSATVVDLPTTINGELVPVNTKEMNKAIVALNGGALDDPIVVKEVYVRLKAVVSDAVNNPVDNDTIVKALYSNVIKLKVKPYTVPLDPYYDVPIRTWYIIGLGGNWTNNKSALGTSLIPLSVVDENAYNIDGDGTFVYTGYFSASSGFKLIRDIEAWNPQWGMTDGSFTYDSGDNITVPTDGYYTITLNSIENKLTIEPADITPTIFTSMGLIGEFNDWGADVNLTSNANTGGHVWYGTITFNADHTTDGGCKLRANGNWDNNWGAEYFPYGLGVQNGKNILFKAGTYHVVFNDITGGYYFVK